MSPAELALRSRNALTVHDYPLAERFAKKLREVNAGDPGVHILLGNIYAKMDQGNNAILAFQRAIELDPENAEAHNNSGVVYKRVGNIPAAINAFERARQLAPDRADVLYNLGNIYKQAGDFGNAERSYRKAIEIDPSFLLSYNNLGSMFEAQGKHEEAVRTYRAGLERDPNNPMLRYNLGVALDAGGTPGEALPEYQHALRSRPGWVDGLNNLGVVLEKLDRTDRAVRIFEEILNQNPENTKVKNNLGHALAKQGNNDRAARYFTEALEEDPSYAHAAFNLEQIREEAGDFEGALQALGSLENPDVVEESELLLRRARVFTALGRLREADGDLKRVLGRQPANARAHIARGNLYRRAGKPEVALTSYRKALSLDVNAGEARMNSAMILREQGKLSEAVEEIGRIPPTFDSRMLLAQLRTDQEQYEEASRLFEGLHDERPADDSVLHHLVDVYKRSGAREEAMRSANELANIHGGVESSQEIDRLSESLEIYERAAEEVAQMNEELVQRSIRALSADSWEELSPDEASGLESESLLFGEMPDLSADEAAIIDVGGIEPIIAVAEEEDKIHLQELEEEWEPFIPPEDAMKEGGPAGGYAAPPYQAPAPQSGTGGRNGAGAGGRGGEKGSLAAEEREDPYDRPADELAEPKPRRRSEPEPPPSWPTEPPRPSQPMQVTGTLRIEMIQVPPPKSADEPSAAPAEEAPSAPASKPARPPEARHAEEDGEEKPAELFSYLDRLTRYLPDDQRSIFDGSDMHLRLETIQRRLRGEPGLRRQAETRGAPRQGASSPLTQEKIKETLTFIDKLSDFHPDRSIGLALKYKIAHILGKLRN
ncbi:MAG TPA: tetratricopeptide repeat protein [Spirochaetia bacterium]|nr:tetratricopeptide repeat protein [Spirochaetia bacterium]